MIRWLHFLATVIAGIFRSRASLSTRVAALRHQRHQLALYKERGLRPKIRPADRLLGPGYRGCGRSGGGRCTSSSRRWCSNGKGSDFGTTGEISVISQSRPAERPKIAPELRTLIKRMWLATTWRSPRIVLELNKLGIDVAKSTVERYQPKGGRSSSPAWKTFLASHASELASMDFFVVPTAGLKVLFVRVILGHGRRRVFHANVTEHPTAEWIAQQLVEAFPFDTAPRYLIG